MSGPKAMDPLARGGQRHQTVKTPPHAHQQQTEGFIDRHQTFFFVIHVILFALIFALAIRIISIRIWNALWSFLYAVSSRFSGSGQQQQKKIN